MNISFFKKTISLLIIVLFAFLLNACKTIKAAVSFKWGKRTESEYHLAAKKNQKIYTSTAYPNPWIGKGPI